MESTRASDLAAPQRASDAPGGAPAPWRPRLVAGARLDLKTLRMATHGWWLGASVVYKPGAHDLAATARELADAGLASGALIVDDAPVSGSTARATRPEHLEHPPTVRAMLIVRGAPPRPQLGMAAASVVAETLESALGRPCAVTWPWGVGLRTGDPGKPFLRVCRISIDVDEARDVAFIGLRFALARLWNARRTARADGEAPSAPLFSNERWREIMLARALHALDVRLRALMAESPAGNAERAALEREWRRRVVAPRRVVVVDADGSRATGDGVGIAPDGALLVRLAFCPDDAASRRFTLDDVVQTWGVGWRAAWAESQTAE